MRGKALSSHELGACLFGYPRGRSGIIRGTGVTGGDGAGAQRDHSILFRTTLRVSAVIYNKVVAECQN